MTTINYYFTLVSPWTFIGDPILRDIAAKHSAEIRHIPVNLGRVFEASGGLPLAKRSAQRKALRLQELRRWRGFREIDFNLEPAFFPTPDKAAAGVVLAAQVSGVDVNELVFAYMRAVWAEERNISEPSTIVEIANENGLDGPALFEQSASQSIKDMWDANTDEAIAAGVMGSPFYIIDNEKFWGQDRLEFVDRHLSAAI